MAPEFLQVLKRFVVRGNATLDTVPTLDGTLLPNDELDSAPAHSAGTVPEPSTLVRDGAGVVVAARDQLLRAEPGAAAWTGFSRLPSRITALARAADGRWLVATESDGIVVLDPDGAPCGSIDDPVASGCVTDLVVLPDGGIVASVGSAAHPAGDWHVGLMSKSTDGSIWRRAGAAGEWSRLAGDLAWPSGLTVAGDDLWFSEAWRHRVLRLPLSGTGAPTVVLRNLPGYPGRIAAAAGGGFWLCVFAMRTQLVEFVLTQDDFRRAMMAEIDPRYWVRPDLRTLNTGLVPLQGGGIKKLGQTKPWAPPRSYGLILRLDDEGTVTGSLHSRAGGTRHGVTGVVDTGGSLVVCAQGADTVLVLPTKEG